MTSEEPTIEPKMTCDDHFIETKMKCEEPTYTETSVQYAKEKGRELEEILLEVSCEFVTTASLKLREAPELIIKHSPSSGESDDEIMSLGTTLILAPDKDNIQKEIKKQEDKYNVEKELKKQEDKENAEKAEKNNYRSQRGKQRKKPKSRSNQKHYKPFRADQREAALAEQLERFAPLRETMKQAAFGLGSEVSSVKIPSVLSSIFLCLKYLLKDSDSIAISGEGR